MNTKTECPQAAGRHKIVITRILPHNCTKEAVASCIIEEGKLAEIYIQNPQQQSQLMNIYIGRVQNIVKNINAAFIEFEKDCMGYYPLEELPTAIFTKKPGKKKLSIGDELLVQVVRGAVKAKAAVLTTNLNFPGKYIVLTTGQKGIGISSKLSGEKRRKLRELVLSNQADDSYCVVVRTNAGEASEEQLITELQEIRHRVDWLINTSRYRTAFSRINEADSEYIRLIKNAYTSQIEEIVTDDPVLYSHIKEYLEAFQPQDLTRLTLYEDRLLPLRKLYNLELQIENALKSHIWLKSGAYLIIEQTEAFAVIDVNTGRYDGRKDKQDTFLKINLEAAREAAGQIRLRNLSGIILIDFINMDSEEDNQHLLEAFRQFVRPDRIQTTVVDMTALGIVEVTRKKERCSLSEILRNFH